MSPMERELQPCSSNSWALVLQPPKNQLFPKDIKLILHWFVPEASEAFLKSQWLPESGCVLDQSFSRIEFLTSWVTLPVFNTDQIFFPDGRYKLNPCYI